jgi:hypothetical protein
MRLKEKTKLPSEHAIQSSYLSWLKLQHPKVYEVTASFPNAGLRDPRYAMRLNREGMKKGFPDLGAVWPSGPYHGMFIEFKSKKGVVREEQAYHLKNLSDRGYFCLVLRSLEEAIVETNKYLLTKS